MGEGREIVVNVREAMADIAPAAWDACANPTRAHYNPFLSHAFLNALETSGCATALTGWQPQHLVIPGEGGTILGAMPLYLKAHSFGEYVFDHGWAGAYERAGGQYYPKLQASVPFTPVTGRRLLVAPGANAAAVERALLDAGIELVRLTGASSLHITFLTEGEWQRHGSPRLLQRTDQQFHWENAGYACFENFMNALASRKRKALRKERREALAAGLTIERVRGGEVTEAHWDAFFAFYQDTGSRKWGSPYLNRRFFSLIGEVLRDDILLIFATRGGRPIAGALNLIGGNTLYGRYWGAVEHHPFLHFELCYYQAIEFAIDHGLARVEAGAQGEHKLARGYLPATTYSLHYLADGGLRRAVAKFLAQEREAVEDEAQMLATLAPFKKTGA